MPCFSTAFDTEPPLRAERDAVGAFLPHSWIEYSSLTFEESSEKEYRITRLHNNIKVKHMAGVNQIGNKEQQSASSTMM